MPKPFHLPISLICLALLAAGCTKPSTPAQTSVPVAVPAGWQTITDQAKGIRAIVPQSLQYKGCTQPVKLGMVDGQYMLGAYFDPCSKHTGSIQDESFSDVFSGWSIIVDKDVKSAVDAQAAVSRDSNGDCKLEFQDWSKDQWRIVEARHGVNQWAPSPCGLLNDQATVHGFYDAQRHSFVYWPQTPKQFSVAQDEYVDDQIQILPAE